MKSAKRKTAANFANAHESQTENMIRALRLDSRLICFHLDDLQRSPSLQKPTALVLWLNAEC